MQTAAFRRTRRSFYFGGMAGHAGFAFLWLSRAAPSSFPP
jgi:hypothetical protein